MAERTHVHLDAVGGLAGDMFAAAMLDAVPDLVARVTNDLAAVLPPEAGRPTLARGTSSGMAASRVGLAEKIAKDNGHSHHHCGGYAVFRRRIEAAALSEGTAARASDILRLIAEAEAEIHDVPIDEVHFHELADWDTLMDIVAAGSIAAGLGQASWSVSALPLGAGLVETAHGRLPVPAPATLRILRGYEWREDGIEGERVTPTGAAILAHLTGGAGNGARPGGRLVAVGTGAGTRTLAGMPNILRASVFVAGSAHAEALTLVSFEIDDMTGEEIATAADRLRAAPGVRDVLLLPAQGKKGRPVTRFEIQAEPAQADAVADAVFTETSTLGLRRSEVLRDTLERRAETAASGLRRKRALRPGGNETVKVEHDDVAGLAGLAARRRAGREAES